MKENVEYDRVVEGLTQCVGRYKLAHKPSEPAGTAEVDQLRRDITNIDTRLRERLGGLGKPQPKNDPSSGGRNENLLLVQSVPHAKKYKYAPVAASCSDAVSCLPKPDQSSAPGVKELFAVQQNKVAELSAANEELRQLLEHERAEKQRMFIELSESALRQQNVVAEESAAKEKFTVEAAEENKQLRLDVESLKQIVRKRTEQANATIKKLSQDNAELKVRVKELEGQRLPTVSAGDSEKIREQMMELKGNCIRLQVDYKIQGESMTEMFKENVRLKAENEAIMGQMNKLKAALVVTCAKSG